MPGGFEDTKAPAKAQGGWTWVPPAQTGYQEEGTSLLPLGRYRMPDGSQQVSFGLPQGLLDAYRSVRYGLGYEQDPNAPKGYTSFDAMNKGAFGAAGGAITGALGAGAARAIRSGMPRNVVSSGGAPEPPMKPITAYHGSPHDFDRFDLSRIGTGEGAQAYGHGLYFAESPAVAKNYRDALARGPNDDPVWNLYNLMQSGLPRDEARRMFQEIVDDGAKTWPKDQRAGRVDFARRTIDAIDNGTIDAYKPPGRLYKVEINARPEQFLDWDKPLSQQGKAVREALAGIYDDATTGEAIVRQSMADARDVAIMRGDNASTTLPASQARAAKALRELGIPGIRYLDAGSRTDGKGTYNYVIFDDSLVRIAEKYGFIIPGPNGMPAVSEQDMATVQALAERENTAAP